MHRCGHTPPFNCRVPQQLSQQCTAAPGATIVTRPLQDLLIHMCVFMTGGGAARHDAKRV